MGEYLKEKYNMFSSWHIQDNMFTWKFTVRQYKAKTSPYSKSY